MSSCVMRRAILHERSCMRQQRSRVGVRPLIKPTRTRRGLTFTHALHVNLTRYTLHSLTRCSKQFFAPNMEKNKVVYTILCRP
jgi:hypothetical protein